MRYPLPALAALALLFTTACASLHAIEAVEPVSRPLETWSIPEQAVAAAGLNVPLQAHGLPLGRVLLEIETCANGIEKRFTFFPEHVPPEARIWRLHVWEDAEGTVQRIMVANSLRIVEIEWGRLGDAALTVTYTPLALAAPMVRQRTVIAKNDRPLQTRLLAAPWGDLQHIARTLEQLVRCAQESSPADPGTTATIHTSMGDIAVRLFHDEAPLHVANFIRLAERGVYDGVLFHRVIWGFMIQGGDPLTRDPGTRDRMGTGFATDADGKEIRLPAEFNDIPHRRGILSMARAMNPNSASAQFFITAADVTFLDRQFTVFGAVVSGMDVVDRIAMAPRDARDYPLELITIEAVSVHEH